MLKSIVFDRKLIFKNSPTNFQLYMRPTMKKSKSKQRHYFFKKKIIKTLNLSL